MNRAGERLVAAASWLVVAGLFVAPATLGRLQDDRDLCAHIALCLILGSAAVGALLARAPRPRWGRADWLLVALLAAYAVSSFRTVFPRGTLTELMRLADYLGLYILVRVLCGTPRMLAAAAAAFAAGAALCGAWGIQEYLVTLAVLHDRSWRAFGPFYNPNLLAGMLLMAIPLWAGLLVMARSGAVRLFCGFAFFLCWAGFFLTGSKGGAIALMGALLLGAAIAPDPARRGASRRALIGVGIVCVALAGALLLPPIKARLLTALGTQSNSTMFRYYTWVGTWHMALARPVLGFGPGTFPAAYPRYALAGYTKLAHQTYLQVAAETGFVGLLAFVAALAAQLRSGVLAARRLAGESRIVAAGATAGMLGFCIHNMVDYGWHVTATGMGFWILAGLVGAAWGRAGNGTEGFSVVSSREDTTEKPSVPFPVRRRRGRASDKAPVPRRSLAVPVVAGALAVLAALPAVLALRAMQRAAWGDLEGASRLDPLDPEYHISAALTAEQRGRVGQPGGYEVATREWHLVQRLRPTYPGASFNLARIDEASDKPEEALREYERTVALAPTWPKALVAEAQLLERIGQKGRALDVYRRLDALSESPLFRYPAVENDFDPYFAYAWVALAEVAPAREAREWTVRAARYLRQVLQANRRMEGLWRAAGEWEDKQGAQLKQLAEIVARRHLAYKEPGPRLRAALLLVDSDQTALARALFVTPGKGITGDGVLGRLIDGWSEYTTSIGLRGKGDQKGADALREAAAKRLAEPLKRRDVVAELAKGPDGFSTAELASLRSAAGT